MENKPQIIIVTDAWYPHLSGVLRVVLSLEEQLTKSGYSSTIVHPKSFPSIPMPFYPEIRLAFPSTFRRKVSTLLREHKNVRVHIMTEGPLGLTMRNYCIAHGLAFTTSFHTHWHKYARTYLRIPERVTLRYIQTFHDASSRVYVPSEEVKEELVAFGFKSPVVVCPNGVDTTLFRPSSDKEKADKPTLLYVGRISKEKNIRDFLNISIDGYKKVVGDGPERTILEQEYPDTTFLGPLEGERLVSEYQKADVFVFPSKTDTFGIVLLESLACGVPVAAYPISGPRTVITHERCGSLDDDLSVAIQKALEKGSSEACVAHASTYSWESITKCFVGELVEAGTPRSVSRTLQHHMLTVPREFYRLLTDIEYTKSFFGLDSLMRFVSSERKHEDR